jgi:hypothetical protein
VKTLMLGRTAVLTVASCAALACSSEQTPDKVVPAGTTLTVRLTEPVSSEGREAGDAVHAETIATLYGDAAEILLPAGTPVRGTVVNVDPQGNDRMTLAFGEIETEGGRTCAIVGRPITVIALSPEPAPAAAMSGDVLAGESETERLDEHSVMRDVPGEGVRAQVETVEVPAGDEGTIELPRGQTLAVHILEPARLSVQG